MKIAFLTRYDPKDMNCWSGTMYHIYHKLKERHQVEFIGADLMRQLSSYKIGNFPSKTYNPTEHYIAPLGRLLSERMNVNDYDLIILAELLFFLSDLQMPFIHFSDMTFEQFMIHHKKPDKRYIKLGIDLERLSLLNACKIIYSSEWAKQKAVTFHHIEPSKIEVVEFGANIPTPTEYAVDIDTDICRLVFIGTDWERKGGDKVLQAYRQLKREGFPCTLTVIGSALAGTSDVDEGLTVIPFLDKSKPADLERLCRILSESHFLVLPTRFDAFGIVFCEASAYGVPSITADVGGVSQAVREGRNGFLLPADATASDYAAKIKTVFSDRESYQKLRKSSRHEFETRLNWDVWGEKVNRIFNQLGIRN